jgi:hypothetical protein
MHDGDVRSGYRHDPQSQVRQMDLFKNDQPDGIIGAPSWPEPTGIVPSPGGGA